MKNLLTLFAVMLFVVSAYAGIIYDNETNDISASSGSMTVDGSPFADGFTDPTATHTWTADQSYDDNVNLTFGTGGDVDIDFNTGNLVINPQVVGTGHVQIDEGVTGSGVNAGTLNLNSTAAAGLGVAIITQNASGSPAGGDDILRWNMFANDSVGSSHAVSQWVVNFDDVTSTSMDSSMLFSVMNAVNNNDINTTASLNSLGEWTNASGASTKRYSPKSNIELFGSKILNKISRLSVGRWTHVNNPVDSPNNVYGYGPTAEDFWDAFSLGKDPRKTSVPGLGTGSMSGILMAAIQELTEENKKLKERLDVLEITVLQ